MPNALTTLRNKITELQAGWVGQGATSFQNTMASWTRNQDTINKLLEQTAGLIRTAGRDYATSDTDTANRFTTTTDSGPVYHGL